MQNLSQNYYLRKDLFQKDAVPTQSLMKEKMTPALADVYFKSMTPKLKVLAGLEPPLKGGGSDWYMPPEEILKGRAVLKPLKEELKKKLNFIGIDAIGMILDEKKHIKMKAEKLRILKESDISWRKEIVDKCDCAYKEHAALETEHNKNQMQIALNQFSNMYSTSITKFEDLLFEAAVDKIKETREETFQKMHDKYERLLKQQSILLYDQYTEKLNNENARLKAEFIEHIEKNHSNLSDKLHQIHLEKHVAIEKSRKYLECLNLACRVYIALKERQECLKETGLIEQKHAKTTKILKSKLLSTEFEIRRLQEKEREIREFNILWIKKISHVVKHFQQFISYCLNTLPEYADFFINLESLMLLQISDILENPDADSIFIKEFDEESNLTVVPKPRPFYLFCDKNSNPSVNAGLCPKHCSSSASQLPVIIIDKTFLYAACDNFEQFTDKIKDYILGNYEIEDNLIDNHEYNLDVPVEYSRSQQILELKLESSLIQILQQEIANLKDVPTECVGCGIPHCFDCNLTSSSVSRSNSATEAYKNFATVYVTPSGDKILNRKAELCYEREPKWESYMKYLKPKRCDCTKLVKKHLSEHLPAYMRTMSNYDAPELPNYETCSIEKMKSLVRKARRRKITVSLPQKVSNTRDVGSQIDGGFDFLCTCLSDDAIYEFYTSTVTRDEIYYDKGHLKMVRNFHTQTYLSKVNDSFAVRRSLTLKRLIEQSPDVEEIFKRRGCLSHT